MVFLARLVTRKYDDFFHICIYECAVGGKAADGHLNGAVVCFACGMVIGLIYGRKTGNLKGIHASTCRCFEWI